MSSIWHSYFLLCLDIKYYYNTMFSRSYISLYVIYTCLQTKLVCGLIMINHISALGLGPDLRCVTVCAEYKQENVKC